MKITLTGFLAWVKEQDPEMGFNWLSNSHCGTAQYLQTLLPDEHIRVFADGYRINGEPFKFPDVIHNVHLGIQTDCQNTPHPTGSFRITYGDLAARIETEKDN